MQILYLRLIFCTKDLNPDESALKKLLEIQKAYSYVLDPEKKKYYDENAQKVKESN